MPAQRSIWLPPFADQVVHGGNVPGDAHGREEHAGLDQVVVCGGLPVLQHILDLRPAQISLWIR